MRCYHVLLYIIHTSSSKCRATYSLLTKHCQLKYIILEMEPQSDCGSTSTWRGKVCPAGQCVMPKYTANTGSMQFTACTALQRTTLTCAQTYVACPGAGRMAQRLIAPTDKQLLYALPLLRIRHLNTARQVTCLPKT